MGIIDILQMFVKRLGLIEEMVCNKVIMMRINLYIIRNVTQILFQRHIKLMKINRFDWLKQIAELFYF